MKNTSWEPSAKTISKEYYIAFQLDVVTSYSAPKGWSIYQHRHCEERSDEATQQVITGLRLGCFILLRSPRNDGVDRYSAIPCKPIDFLLSF